MIKFRSQYILSFFKISTGGKTLWTDIISNFLFLVMIHSNQGEESTMGRNTSKPVIKLSTDQPLSIIPD